MYFIHFSYFPFHTSEKYFTRSSSQSYTVASRTRLNLVWDGKLNDFFSFQCTCVKHIFSKLLIDFFIILKAELTDISSAVNVLIFRWCDYIQHHLNLSSLSCPWWYQLNLSQYPQICQFWVEAFLLYQNKSFHIQQFCWIHKYFGTPTNVLHGQTY